MINFKKIKRLYYRAILPQLLSFDEFACQQKEEKSIDDIMTYAKPKVFSYLIQVEGV